jgi:hypothetical protein
MTSRLNRVSTCMKPDLYHVKGSESKKLLV